jgi:RNA polymerase sigma factor (sigma-70 family)
MQYQEYDLKRARNIVDPKTGEKMTIPSREDSYERLQEMAVQFPEENRSVEDQILKKIECEQLHKFLLELSKEEQWLIQELYFEERTEREVASVLGLSQKAINKRRQKILEKLRKLF